MVLIISLQYCQNLIKFLTNLREYGLNTKDILIKDCLMDREFILKLTVRAKMVHGSKVFGMDMKYLLQMMFKSMKEVGLIIREMGKVNKFTQMVQSTKVPGSWINHMDTEFLLQMMVRNMKEVGLKEKEMDREFKLTQMVQATKVPGNRIHHVDMELELKRMVRKFKAFFEEEIKMGK